MFITRSAIAFGVAAVFFGGQAMADAASAPNASCPPAHSWVAQDSGAVDPRWTVHGFAGSPSSTAISADNSFALVSDRYGPHIWKVDLTDGSKAKITPKMYNQVHAVEISPDMKWALFTSAYGGWGAIYRVDLVTDQALGLEFEKTTMVAGDNLPNVAGMSISKDMTYALVAQKLDVLKLNLTDYSTTMVNTGYFKNAVAVSLSPDESYALVQESSAHYYGIQYGLQRLDMATGKSTLVYHKGGPGHLSWASGMALSKDGTFALIATPNEGGDFNGVSQILRINSQDQFMTPAAASDVSVVFLPPGGSYPGVTLAPDDSFALVVHGESMGTVEKIETGGHCKADPPTGSPTPGPTSNPTPGPTGNPTPGPTGNPTPGPTGNPTPGPTSSPTTDHDGIDAMLQILIKKLSEMEGMNAKNQDENSKRLSVIEGLLNQTPPTCFGRRPQP